MRWIVLLGLGLSLSGCGYKTWWNPPFTGGSNPNRPVSDSENMQRVMGGVSTMEPITTEPGDIWPGPLPPAPTLKDLETTGGLTTQPEQAVPGSPLSRGSAPPMVSPNPSTGSSTPPANLQPPPGLATPQPAPPLTSYAAPPVAPPRNGPSGQVLQVPGAPNVVTGGGPGYQTTIGPGGAQSIVVPNGNGTSTVIHPDGRIETVPTAK
ncbi:hypothetical protein [Rhodopila sp.]|uniref:hypothetical protein n=1 Tax=Rhodopila sp. TaxID=2480087 RepID=UPI003D0CFCE6